MDAKSAAQIRNTPGLIKEIETLRDALVRRFSAVINLAQVEKTDRNTTANLQFTMQVETTALIKAAEDLQTLIRQLQEMWLFGPLNTVGESQEQVQTDETAKVVGELLQQLVERQESGQIEANGVSS